MIKRTDSSGALIVGWLYGTWLSAINVIFYTASESKNALEMAVLAGVIPAAAQLIVFRLDTSGWSRLWLYSWAFIVVICAGYTYSIQTWQDLISVLNLVFIFAIAMTIAGCADGELLMRLCPPYAILSAGFLVFINLTGEYVWGRLSAGLQPNVWGLIALSVGIAAFGVRNRLIAIACWMAALLTLYNASSRGSMVGLAFAGVLFFWYWLVHSHHGHISWRLAATVIGVSACTYLVISFPDLPEDVLRINDPRRGFGADFAERGQPWSEAIDVWLSAPILGVGFRKHEELMGFSAHNAYLAMLADTGIVGLSVYVMFIAQSVMAAMSRIRSNKLRYLILAAIVSYAVLGLFERRALNTGNAFSIFFIMACYVALRQSAPACTTADGVRCPTERLILTSSQNRGR
jgi:O-antigen ligase